MQKVGTMQPRNMESEDGIMAGELSKQALLGIIYGWYTSLKIEGVDEENIILAMCKSWKVVADVYNKDSTNANDKAQEIAIKLNQAIKKKPNSINAITGPASLNKLFNENYDKEWMEGDWKWE